MTSIATDDRDSSPSVARPLAETNESSLLEESLLGVNISEEPYVTPLKRNDTEQSSAPEDETSFIEKQKKKETIMKSSLELKKSLSRDKSSCEFYNEELHLDDGELPSLKVHFKTPKVNLSEFSSTNSTPEAAAPSTTSSKKSKSRRRRKKGKSKDADKDKSDSDNEYVTENVRRLSPSSSLRHRAFWNQLNNLDDDTTEVGPADEIAPNLSKSASTSNVQSSEVTKAPTEVIEDEDEDNHVGNDILSKVVDVCSVCTWSQPETKSHKMKNPELAKDVGSGSQRRRSNSETNLDHSRVEAYIDDDDNSYTSYKSRSHKKDEYATDIPEGIDISNQDMYDCENTAIEVEYMGYINTEYSGDDNYEEEVTALTKKYSNDHDDDGSVDLNPTGIYRAQKRSAKKEGFLQIGKLGDVALYVRPNENEIGSDDERNISAAASDIGQSTTMMDTNGEHMLKRSKSVCSNASVKKSFIKSMAEKAKQEFLRKKGLNATDKDANLNTAGLETSYSSIADDDVSLDEILGAKNEDVVSDPTGADAEGKTALPKTVERTLTSSSENDKDPIVSSITERKLYPHLPTKSDTRSLDTSSLEPEKIVTPTKSAPQTVADSPTSPLKEEDETSTFSGASKIVIKKESLFKRIKSKSGGQWQQVNEDDDGFDSQIYETKQRYIDSSTYDADEVKSRNDVSNDKNDEDLNISSNSNTIASVTYNPYHDSSDVSVLGASVATDCMSVASGKSLYTTATNATSWSVSTRKRHRGAAKSRIKEPATPNPEGDGWMKSIKAAAAANGKEWDPKTGWVGYEEPDSEKHTPPVVASLGRLKPIKSTSKSLGSVKEESYHEDDADVSQSEGFTDSHDVVTAAEFNEDFVVARVNVEDVPTETRASKDFETMSLSGTDDGAASAITEVQSNTFRNKKLKFFVKNGNELNRLYESVGEGTEVEEGKSIKSDETILGKREESGNLSNNMDGIKGANPKKKYVSLNHNENRKKTMLFDWMQEKQSQSRTNNLFSSDSQSNSDKGVPYESLASLSSSEVGTDSKVATQKEERSTDERPNEDKTISSNTKEAQRFDPFTLPKSNPQILTEFNENDNANVKAESMISPTDVFAVDFDFMNMDGKDQTFVDSNKGLTDESSKPKSNFTSHQDFVPMNLYPSQNAVVPDEPKPMTKKVNSFRRQEKLNSIKDDISSTSQKSSVTNNNQKLKSSNNDVVVPPPPLPQQQRTKSIEKEDVDVERVSSKNIDDDDDFKQLSFDFSNDSPDDNQVEPQSASFDESGFKVIQSPDRSSNVAVREPVGDESRKSKGAGESVGNESRESKGAGESVRNESRKSKEAPIPLRRIRSSNLTQSSQRSLNEAKRWLDKVNSKKKNNVDSTNPTVESTLFVSAHDEDSTFIYKEPVKVNDDEDDLFNFDDEDTLFNFDKCGINEQHSTIIGCNVVEPLKALADKSRSTVFLNRNKSRFQDADDWSEQMSEITTPTPPVSEDGNDNNIMSRITNCAGPVLSHLEGKSDDKDGNQDGNNDMPFAHLAFLRGNNNKPPRNDQSSASKGKVTRSLLDVLSSQTMCGRPETILEEDDIEEESKPSPRLQRVNSKKSDSVTGVTHSSSSHNEGEKEETKNTKSSNSNHTSAKTSTKSKSSIAQLYLESISSKVRCSSPSVDDAIDEKGQSQTSQAWKNFLDNRKSTTSPLPRQGSGKSSTSSSPIVTTSKTVSSQQPKFPPRKHPSVKAAEAYAQRKVDEVMKIVNNTDEAKDASISKKSCSSTRANNTSIDPQKVQDIMKRLESERQSKQMKPPTSVSSLKLSSSSSFDKPLTTGTKTNLRDGILYGSRAPSPRSYRPHSFLATDHLAAAKMEYMQTSVLSEI